MSNKMTKLTKDQIEFAESMTIKQRGVLRALAMFDWFMSASERGDNELYELIRNGLARCYPHSKDDGLLSWGATEAGRTIAHRIKEGAL
jgi:hypothetical protein